MSWSSGKDSAYALDRARSDPSLEIVGLLTSVNESADRERQLAGTGLAPVFPLWGADTRELADEMLRAGVVSSLTCVDLARLPIELVGRRWDASSLRELPEGTDPCGERGEFYTFVSDGPGFSAPVEHRPEFLCSTIDSSRK